MSIRILAVSICLVVMAQQSPAGLAIQVETKSVGAQAGTTYTHEALVDGNNVKFNAGAGQGMPENTEMLYRGDRNVMVHIDHGQQSYMELTEAQFETMGQQVDVAMKQMQEQMANMPPEQRAMMEKMMGSMMPKPKPAAPKTPVTVRETSETETIDGLSCKKYDIFKGSDKQAEVWSAAWGDVGVKRGDMDAFKSLSAMYDKMTESLQSMSIVDDSHGVAFKAFTDIDGYPVLIRRYEKGTPVEETRMGKPERRDMDASSFEPPAGYKKMAPPTS